VSVGSSELVNVQVTSSPGSTLKVATPVPVSPELSPSSHVISVKSQPDGTVSVESYCPGATSCVAVWPSVREPDTSPVKVNDCGSPSGRVCFSMVIEPSLVFVKVQVTVSPAARPTTGPGRCDESRRCGKNFGFLAGPRIQFKRGARREA